MNSRERGKLTLEHKEPDRIPFDLGGTVLTSISVHSYKRLREYMGLPEVDPKIMDIFQQIVVIDDDVHGKAGLRHAQCSAALLSHLQNRNQ